ncbi:MAG: phage recombination protein Bet [Pseudomonadota bacterium]
MTQALAVNAAKSQQATAFVPGEKELKLIKETICRGANDLEFDLFITHCKRVGLNPLARQVYAVRRWDSQLKRESMTIQVSIDGFRLIAERTGKYAGQVGPWWCGDDGAWVDVWTSKEPPVAAKVGVLRCDFTEPCLGVARLASYAQRKRDGSMTSMWAKMPDVMLAKCAESLALRRAFPQELSGLYTSDEMMQSSEPPQLEHTSPETTALYAQVQKAISAARTLKTLEAAWRKNEPALRALNESDAGRVADLKTLLNERHKTLQLKEQAKDAETPEAVKPSPAGDDVPFDVPPEGGDFEEQGEPAL